MAEPRGYEASYQRSRNDDAKNSASLEGSLRRPQREYGRDNLASNVQSNNSLGKTPRRLFRATEQQHGRLHSQLQLPS